MVTNNSDNILKNRTTVPVVQCTVARARFTSNVQQWYDTGTVVSSGSPPVRLRQSTGSR